jgi:hypothetical protein
VLSRLSVHNNTYNSPWQGPPGGITIENNVEIKNFKSIYLWKKIFIENSQVLPQKTGNFRSLLPVNQLTWKKQKSFTCQTFTLVNDTKNLFSISFIISVIMLTRVGFIEKKSYVKYFLFEKLCLQKDIQIKFGSTEKMNILYLSRIFL